MHEESVICAAGDDSNLVAVVRVPPCEAIEDVKPFLGRTELIEVMADPKIPS